MKKLFLVLAAVAMLLPGCKKINEELDALGARLDKLEQETIPTIDEQIAAINTTLGDLDAMDKELKGFIDDLQATADNLQEQINATNTKIDDVKAALQGEISTAKAEVLAELEALETELKNELAQINATIETLKDKDEELDKKIADLKTYVDTELGKTTDWVNATFATLEQYNALVSEVATIKEQIKAINQSITELKTQLTTKINEDIANAVASLSADIQQKVNEITEAYTNAVKTAKEEITTAYTAAIQTAITTLDNSLKTWVGEQLANYYTIAEVEAKITTLQTAITEGDASLQEELKSLKSQLETTATEITTAYKKAIEEAITTNNGVIDTKIANEIASVNQRITNEVATINAKIAEIESRLDNVEAKIAELLARIQSVSYIPTYDDGKATVKYYESTSRVTLDFEISPKDAVVELAKVWKNAVSVKAIYTQTRAVSFIEMPITNFESDATNGIISVTASGENLSAEFFNGTQSASARLSISDGNNSVVSEYVPMIAKVEIKEVPNNEIWYTSSDENIVTPYSTIALGARIVTNEWIDSKSRGVIVFDRDITKIGENAFFGCESITSITIPDSVTKIEAYSFANCHNLEKVIIPNSVTEIGAYAFGSCSSLVDAIIPNSVTKIEDGTFQYCRSLESITITNSVTSIGNDAFSGCTALTSVTIPNSVTSIGRGTFRGCSSLNAFYGKFASSDNRCLIIDGVLTSFASSGLTNYTIPDDVTEIGSYAFVSCSLESLTISDKVTSIDSSAFTYGDKLKRANVLISDLAQYSVENPMHEIHCAKYLYNASGSKERLSLTIPIGVTKIGERAFYYCSSLTSVTIPDSVTEIEESAFWGCDNLSKISCKNTIPPKLACGMDDEGDILVWVFPHNVIDIYVPTTSISTYKAAIGWNYYADFIVSL